MRRRQAQQRGRAKRLCLARPLLPARHQVRFPNNFCVKVKKKYLKKPARGGGGLGGERGGRALQDEGEALQVREGFFF